MGRIPTWAEERDHAHIVILVMTGPTTGRICDADAPTSLTSPSTNTAMITRSWLFD